MRPPRVVVFGLFCTFPGIIVVYLLSFAICGCDETWAQDVFFFCSIIPFGFEIIGLIWSWINGEEYDVGYQR